MRVLRVFETLTTQLSLRIGLKVEIAPKTAYGRKEWTRSRLLCANLIERMISRLRNNSDSTTRKLTGSFPVGCSICRYT